MDIRTHGLEPIVRRYCPMWQSVLYDPHDKAYSICTRMSIRRIDRANDSAATQELVDSIKQDQADEVAHDTGAIGMRLLAEEIDRALCADGTYAERLFVVQMLINRHLGPKPYWMEEND